MGKSKRIIPVILSWLPAILCAVVIFLLSAQNGTDSAALSSETMSPFALLLERLFGENGHNVFRKFAHFFLYCALSFLTCFACFCTRRKNALSPWLPIGISVLYAISDEIHQYFVPERACRLFDVGVDTLGCLVGAACFYLLVQIIRRIRKKISGKRGMKI